MKVLTHQHLSEEANRTSSAVASRISGVRATVGHARACNWHLGKYFLDQG